MKFPYRRYGAEGDLIHRPELTIRVIGSSAEERVDGLLDTGADQVLLPRSMADRIGATIDEGERWAVEGFAGQSSEAVIGSVIFEIGQDEEVYRWRAEVCFVDGEQDVLLGHLGFLDYFDAEFLGKEKQVVLKPNGTFPPGSAEGNHKSEGGLPDQKS